MTKNSKQSLIEIVSYLFDYLEKNDTMFNPKKHIQVGPNKFREVDPKQLEAFINSEINQHSSTLQ